MKKMVYASKDDFDKNLSDTLKDSLSAEAIDWYYNCFRNGMKERTHTGRIIMRRKDIQINDMEEIKSIILENNLLHLGLSENNLPYIVPINYGYDGEFLYLHCATEGKKLDIIKNSMTKEGAPCCFEISDSIKVLIKEESSECTTHYRSIVGFGKVIFINDINKKMDALKILVKHIENREPTSLPEAVVKRTCMLRIKIEEITGKKSPVK